MTDRVQHFFNPQPGEAQPWLQAFKQRAAAQLNKHQWPGRKTESWKYTSLKSLETGDFKSVAAASELSDSEREQFAQQAIIENLDTFNLVFIDGFYHAALSSPLENLPQGCELVFIDQAKPEQQEKILQKLDSVSAADKHLFAALNSASLENGVYLRVQKNTRVQTVFKLVYINSEAASESKVCQRLLVELETGAEASLIEYFAAGATQQGKVFTNGITELCLADNARLNHYRFNFEQDQAIHIGGVHTHLGRNSQLNSFYLATGSVLKRLDIVVNYSGEGAHAELRAVYLPRGKELVDFHTCIEHAVPNCTSNEIFRGIISDSARAVCNCRIHIHPDAQKTHAQLSNKNLLTSNKAEVDTKPELEIYADDVQCAHGATVAQLDDQALHYMLTRGVPEEEARVMLSFGFINELINDLSHAEISEHLRPLLANLFARDEKLMRHLG